MITDNLEQTDVKHPLHLSHSYKASASKVFEAWTTPALAEQWLFKNATNQINFQIDPQEGGEFSVMEYDEGKAIVHFGEFLKISKPDILVFTLAVPERFEGVSVVRVDIEPVSDGCRLTLTQTNIDTTKTAEAWRLMLTNLKEMLNNESHSSGCYEAHSAKQSTLIRMVLEDHNITYRIEHNINSDGQPTERYFVDLKNDEWMQQNISTLDLALENATDADLLWRFDDELKTDEPTF
ncbi:MAG: SRPBCC family protein [Chryseolinea sp.]